MNVNITNEEPTDEKFLVLVSPLPHLVKAKTSTERIAKNTKRISQSPSRLRMTGKLALDVHRSFKEHVQTIGPLHKLKCDAHKEQLLKLLREKSARTKAYDQSRDEAAPSHNEVE
ncbi:hypothetical protein DXG03_005365 [Asterophora parasitica]|uniref:Uncharacterized protein n=1 Tax=Asterophora parasitica TaxID=117018 RepID=A0A9P7K8Q4_9AGAR|nr:hypothetical protein DXG03_005365 [Asterophora parasitica]